MLFRSPVLEKAFADDHSGYAALNNGVYDALAMETFTGQHASWEATDDMSLAHLRRQLNRFADSSSAIVTFDTPTRKSQMPYNLIDDHAYMFDGLEVKNGHTYVALMNPWGDHEPRLIPLNAVANNFDQINYGKV